MAWRGSSAQRFHEVFGQQFIVENRTGAGGAIAVEAVARSPADGTTLLWGVQPQIVILPAISKVPYDPVKDLAPISVLATNPFVLVVNARLPVNTVAEFVEHVRAQPATLSYASSGVGSVAHLAMALFLKRAGLDMTSVHYRGNAPALADVVAGHLPTMFSRLADALPHAASGGVRLLAVSGAKRAAQIPEVPTVSEQGYPGYSVVTWNGLMAPAGTPKPIIERIAAEMARAVKDPQSRRASDRLRRRSARQQPGAIRGADRGGNSRVDRGGRPCRGQIALDRQRLTTAAASRWCSPAACARQTGFQRRSARK